MPGSQKRRRTDEKARPTRKVIRKRSDNAGTPSNLPEDLLPAVELGFNSSTNQRLPLRSQDVPFRNPVVTPQNDVPLIIKPSRRPNKRVFLL
jgi:hypothetical protein